MVKLNEQGPNKCCKQMPVKRENINLETREADFLHFKTLKMKC